MINLEQLAKHKNQVLDLTFTDGHVVRAKLLMVDPHDPAEIIYDVIQVLNRGPADLANVKPGTLAAADPSLLVDFTVPR